MNAQIAMNAQWYFFTANRGLTATSTPPAGSRPFAQAIDSVSPEQLFRLHQSFAVWQSAQRSPGLVVPKRIWIDAGCKISFRFEADDQPKLQSPVGAHAGLAAWFVLLDKHFETTTLSEAAKVWPVTDFAGALAFITPAFLPKPLLSLPPDNWERVARRLSAIVADQSQHHLHPQSIGS